MAKEDLSTRDKLILAARALLLEKGHAACSVKAIAARAGVNHGLVHHYFGSKEGLLVAVLEGEAREMLQHVPKQSPVSPDINRFVRAALLGNPERSTLMSEFFTMSRHVPGVAAKLAEILPRRREMMEKLTGVDTVTIALFQGALFGMAVQRLVDPTIPLDEAAHRLTRLIQDAALGLHERAGKKTITE